MKRFFKTLVLFALPVLVGISCTDGIQETGFDEPSVRSVTFAGSAVMTRTGLTMHIVPDWRKTDNAVIHLFEDYEGEVLEGRDPEITTGIDGNYGSAYFKADFSEEISIIVTPPSNAPATKAGSTYKYTAIVSQKADNKFIVPAVQYPDEDTWIDPTADFLVGDGEITSESRSGKYVDLTFKRPVALSRFAFTGLKGNVVKSVKITAEGGLTGTASYSDVNFQTGEVNFDTTNSTTLEMNFGEGRKMATTFYAYFISLPGTIKIYSVEVVTDQFVFTKSMEGGKNMSFDPNYFKNIAVDMHEITPVPVEGGEDEPVDQNLSFFKDNQTITSDSYDLYSANAYVSPVVKGAAEGAAITYSSDATTVATVDADGIVTPVAVGEAVITATAAAVEGYNETSVSYTLTVSDSTPAATEKTYYQVSVLEPGYDYIVVSNGKALKNGGEGNAAYADVTVADSKIVMAEDASILWTAAKPTTTLTEGTYTFTNNGLSFYRISNSGQFNLGINAAPASVTKYYLWDYKENHLTHTSAGSGSSTNYFWFYYDGGWQFSYAATIPTTNPTLLFTARQPQEIAFSGETAVYDLGTSAYTTALPTLTGAKTAVTYASSDETVATVDNAGNVTPIKKGSTTITATAAGSAEYQGAEASYTLSVVNSTSAEIVLNQASAVESGKQYVIVNNGKALQNNNGAFGAVDVTVASDHSTATIATDADLASMTWTWTSSTLNTSYGHYTITNGDDFLYVSGSYSSGYTAQIGAQPTGDNVKYVVWDYSDSQVINGSSSAHRYLTYNNGWTVPTSASSHGTYLFEVVDQRTPQALTFAQAAPELDLASATTFTQTVSGAQTAVTYSSSDEDVATVNNSGVVTAKKTGTVTITATAEANATYQGATASYVLTVKNSNIKVTTYVKVTTAPADWSGTYLFVKESENFAFAYNQTNYKVSVAIADGKIESDDLGTYELTVSKSTAGDGKYDIKTTNGKYLYKYGNSDILFDTNISNSNQYYGLFSLSGSGDITLDSQRNGGSDNYFQYASSKFGYGSSSATFQMYKLDDGAAPVVVKAERNLSFTTASYSKTVKDNSFTNVLSGNKTDDVTYTSSNTDVAIVNSVGQVSIQGIGETTITASAPETDEYKAGSASYVVTVSKVDRSNLAFSYPTVSVNLGETVPANILQGEKEGTTTYKSSDETIATVNDSGEVTTLKAGTVTITATVAETATYKQGTASYELTVIGTAPSGKTYTRVSASSTLANGTYIIVDADNSKALTSTGTTAVTTVSPSGNVIASNDLANCEFVITAVSGGYTIKQANGNNYLVRDSGNSTNYIGYTTSSCVFGKDAYNTDLFCFYATNQSDGKNTEYLYYNKSNSYFKIGGSGSPSSTSSTKNPGVILYKLDGGSTEPPVSTSYYTKVTSTIPSSGEWDKVLFVYENGDGTGYAFKGIYNGTVSSTPAGDQDSNTSYLTTEGNAVPVTITSNGIASTAEVDACTLTMELGSSSKHYLKMNGNGGYFRMLSSGSNAGRFVCMSTGGYRLTYTLSGTGTNNVSAKRDSYYFGFNGTNFAGAADTSYKFSIYKLSE